MPRPLPHNPKAPYRPTPRQGAAALAIALALGTIWEGREHLPYDDKRPWIVLTAQTKLHGVLTVCDGHTDRAGTAPPIVVGRWYSDAECDALSEKDHAAADAAVRKCTPELYANAPTAGAAIDFAYNVGSGAYCRSTLVKAFRAGRIEEGCARMLGWKYQDGKFVPGLLNRRKAEMAKCLEALS